MYRSRFNKLRVFRCRTSRTIRILIVDRSLLFASRQFRIINFLSAYFTSSFLFSARRMNWVSLLDFARSGSTNTEDQEDFRKNEDKLVIFLQFQRKSLIKMFGLFKAFRIEKKLHHWIPRNWTLTSVSLLSAKPLFVLLLQWKDETRPQPDSIVKYCFKISAFIRLRWTFKSPIIGAAQTMSRLWLYVI